MPGAVKRCSWADSSDLMRAYHDGAAVRMQREPEGRHRDHHGVARADLAELLRSGRRRDQHMIDAAAIHTRHLVLHTPNRDAAADRRNTMQPRHDEAAERVIIPAFFVLADDVEQIAYLVERCHSIDDERAIGAPLDRRAMRLARLRDEFGLRAEVLMPREVTGCW